MILTQTDLLAGMLGMEALWWLILLFLPISGRVTYLSGLMQASYQLDVRFSPNLALQRRLTDKEHALKEFKNELTEYAHELAQSVHLSEHTL